MSFLYSVCLKTSELKLSSIQTILPYDVSFHNEDVAGRCATDDEIERLLAEIECAFRGVMKGVSWNELRVIDGYGTSEERRAARALDKDKTWQDVANDPLWNPDHDGWSFFDPHGFRYYAAAAMTKALRERNHELGYFEFTFDRTGHYWSEFSEDQFIATANFVLAMSRMTGERFGRCRWREIYEKHWQKRHSILLQDRKAQVRKQGK